MLLAPDRARTPLRGVDLTLKLADLSSVVVLDGLDLDELFLRFDAFLLRRPHRLRHHLCLLYTSPSPRD